MWPHGDFDGSWEVGPSGAWELQDRRKEVDSGSVVAIAQLCGSNALGSI